MFRKHTKWDSSQMPLASRVTFMVSISKISATYMRIYIETCLYTNTLSMSLYVLGIFICFVMLCFNIIPMNTSTGKGGNHGYNLPVIHIRHNMSIRKMKCMTRCRESSCYNSLHSFLTLYLTEISMNCMIMSNNR